MKTKFELKEWLGKNRLEIIAKHDRLKSEKFFSGISLSCFMVDVLNSMTRNNIKSEKRASEMLPFLMGNIYFQNSTVSGRDVKSEILADLYAGKSEMAMV